MNTIYVLVSIQCDIQKSNLFTTIGIIIAAKSLVTTPFTEFSEVHLGKTLISLLSICIVSSRLMDGSDSRDFQLAWGFHHMSCNKSLNIRAIPESVGKSQTSLGYPSGFILRFYSYY